MFRLQSFSSSSLFSSSFLSSSSVSSFSCFVRSAKQSTRFYRIQSVRQLKPILPIHWYYHLKGDFLLVVNSIFFNETQIKRIIWLRATAPSFEQIKSKYRANEKCRDIRRSVSNHLEHSTRRLPLDIESKQKHEISKDKSKPPFKLFGHLIKRLKHLFSYSKRIGVWSIDWFQFQFSFESNILGRKHVKTNRTIYETLLEPQLVVTGRLWQKVPNANRILNFQN